MISLRIQLEVKIQTRGRWRLYLTLINLLVRLALLYLIDKALVLCPDSTRHVTSTV